MLEAAREAEREELERVRRLHAVEIAKCEQALSSLVLEKSSLVEVSVSRLTSIPLASLTPDDIHFLCSLQHITHQASILLSKGVDGKKLSKVLQSIPVIMKLIGCQSFGDCVYFVHTLKTLRSTQTLVPPRKCNKFLTSINALDQNQIATNEAAQARLYQHMESRGLGQVVPLLDQHDVNDEVLNLIDLTDFAAVDESIIEIIDELSEAISSYTS